jgi:hypothetical protein
MSAIIVEEWNLTIEPHPSIKNRNTVYLHTVNPKKQADGVKKHRLNSYVYNECTQQVLFIDHHRNGFICNIAKCVNNDVNFINSAVALVKKITHYTFPQKKVEFAIEI